MIALTRHIKLLLLSLLTLFASSFASSVTITTSSSPSPAPSASSSTTENYAPLDTIFEEIILTEEGIKAYDTSGHEWYYDFEYSVFVVGIPPDEYEYSYEFLNNVPIEERAIIRKRVKPFEAGAVTVRPDEYVDGSIQAYEMVTVKGWVKGDVISLSDRVFVTETGRVDGNVKAPKVIRKEGGIVNGEIVETIVPIELKDITSGFSHEFLMVMIIITMAFLFLGFLILAVMPNQVARIENCIVKNKARCSVLGFIIVLVLPALIVLLAITIVGAVLIPLLPVVYFFGMFMGIVATGKAIGNYVSKKFIGKGLNSILIGLIGIVVLMLPWIMAGALLGGSSDSSVGLGVFFLVFSIVITLFPLFSGLGASFLTRFGFREYTSGMPIVPKRGSTVPSPAPPPIPDSPFSQKPETPSSGSRISEE